MLISQDDFLISIENDELDISMLSSIGGRDNQQDSAGYSISEGDGLIVVCDGMGGHQDGKRASSTAVESFLELFASKESGKAVSETFSEIVRKIDYQISNFTDELGNAMNSGTTIVAVHIGGKQLHWVSVGDSRLYICRGKEFVQITRDHTYDIALKENKEAGLISETFYRSEANNSEALISFLGVGDLPLIDINEQPLNLQSGDRLLLMTDGLYKNLPDSTIQSLISNFKNSYEALRVLERKVEQLSLKESINRDNMTVALITVK